MRRRTGARSAHRLLALLVLTTSIGCAPTVDILGVYFPGWLVSAITGLVFSYLAVFWLGRRARSRRLAESGLLFVSLVVASSLAVWWAAFSGGF